MNIFYCKYCKKYSILRMVLYWEDALTVFSTDIIWGGGFQRGSLPRKSLIFAGARTESVGFADLPLSNLWSPLYGRKIFPVQVSADFFPDHILF